MFVSHLCKRSLSHHHRVYYRFGEWFIQNFSVLYIQYVVNGVVACLVVSVIILFSTYQASIDSCDSSILFLCLSYSTTTTKPNGYTRELYYFPSLYRHSDSENVCMFEIRLDIGALISSMNAFSTTFLRNLFVIVHMDISLSFKATIKHLCNIAHFHFELRYSRAL